jgi:hypothetical protein
VNVGATRKVSRRFFVRRGLYEPESPYMVF